MSGSEDSRSISSKSPTTQVSIVGTDDEFMFYGVNMYRMIWGFAGSGLLLGAGLGVAYSFKQFGGNTKVTCGP
jgi:hypothetical protein